MQLSVASPSQRWEHISVIEKRFSVDEINELGKDGWELVNAHYRNGITVLYMKRPLKTRM